MASLDAKSEYTHVHRALLQALFARPTLTFAGAQPLLAQLQTAANPDRANAPGDIRLEDLEDHITLINAHISPFDLEIRRTTHQRTKEEVWALVNTTSDALTQMATVHTADEVAFVKRVIDAMFETYNSGRAEVMAVTSMQALRMAKEPGQTQRRESATQGPAAAGLTMNKAEEILGSMVGEGWFELSQKGYYTLSPRALMELRGWLFETYNDEEDDEVDRRIKTCQGCGQIVTMGQRCPDIECPARMHLRCVQGTFQMHGGRERCPLCKAAWEDPLPVGEKAARLARNSESSNARRSSGVETSRAAQRVESDAEES